MFKRVVAFLLSLVIMFTMLPSMVVTAEATAPAKVSQAEATAQLNFLIDEFVNEGTFYFSKGNKACKNGHAGCDGCNIVAVIKESWFKNKVKRVPSTLGLKHYFNDWKLIDGEACCGFANFAGWYIFSHKATDTVTFEAQKVGGEYAPKLSYSALKNALPGDILRFGNNRNSYIGHSAIFVSCNKDGAIVVASQLV